MELVTETPTNSISYLVPDKNRSESEILEQDDSDWLTVAALSFQCAATWRWLRDRTCSKNIGCEDDFSNKQQTNIQISNSLPDLQEQVKPTYVQEIKDIVAKKVLRQTTLPIVPDRHQTFQRQLSHRLDIPTDVKFSICALERNNSSMIGLIKPELYRKELIRQASAESNGGQEMEYCGKLHFSLKYEKELEGLVVKVFESRDLPVKDMNGSCDPYVKLYLFPDRKKKYQTKVHRRNQNPVFNETFIFSVMYEELRDRYLQFSVYDFDRFSRHDLIGHVVFKGLSEIAELHQEVEYTMNILCPPKDKVDLGELMICLCYLPKAGRLTITIIKGHNLKAMDITGKSDPYVKIYLLCQGKRIRKKKTSVKYNTLCPVYNEALVFDVPEENINDVSLVLKVIDYDRIGLNELMGCIVIGPNFIGKGRDHWTEMLDNPRRPVAQWYPLMESIPSNVPPLKDGTISLSCLNSR
ncbi:synaptotagmin-10 [Leptinotarsa decemlineata]|uniref:synaptotagmin-10 n=1 Tax=Leptinotarsa decemlineata TaxID=7539 RepID=UPI003D306ADD